MGAIFDGPAGTDASSAGSITFSSAISFFGSWKPQSLSSVLEIGVLSEGTVSGSLERSTLYSAASSASSCSSEISLDTMSETLLPSSPASCRIAVSLRASDALSGSVVTSSIDASARSLSAGNSSSETETPSTGIASSEAFSAETLSGFSICTEPSASFSLMPSSEVSVGTASEVILSSALLSGIRSAGAASSALAAVVSSAITGLETSSSGTIFFLAIMLSSCCYIFSGSCEPKNRWVPSS